MAEPVTLQEAKDHLRVVFDDEDAYIGGLIAAARTMLEGRIHRALVPQTVTFTAAAFDYYGMKLPRTPYLGELAVEYVDAAGTLGPLDPAAYYLDTTVEPARIYPAPGLTFPATSTLDQRAVRITYQAGYASPADVPASLKQWILLAIGTLYEHRATVAAGVSIATLPEDFMQWLWQPYMVYT